MPVTQEELEEMAKREAAQRAAAAAVVQPMLSSEPNQSVKPPPAAPPPNASVPQAADTGSPDDPFRLGLNAPAPISAPYAGLSSGRMGPTPRVDLKNLPVREVRGSSPDTKTAARAAPSTRDPDLDLSGGAAGGGRGRVIPAGFQPHTMEDVVHEGKAVPVESKKALAAGTSLLAQGAEIEHDAGRQLYEDTKHLRETELRATSDANVAHADVQARRDREVRDRLAEIEATNQDLASTQIDPTRFWKDRGALATVLGVFATMLGAAGSAMSGGPNQAASIIDGAINRDIEAQKANREGKQAALKGQINLLNLHQERLGSEDKAIEATKLAYYENILQQMNIFRAKHGQSVDDATFNKVNADIIERYGATRNAFGIQEQADKQHKFTQNWRAAQVLGPPGGVAPGIREDERVLTIPASDRTGEHETHVAVPKEAYARLEKVVGNTLALNQLDSEALQLRKELRDIGKSDMGTVDKAQRIGTIQRKLQQKWLTRVHLEQKAQDEGVTRKEDFEQARDRGIQYDSGILGHDVSYEGDKVLQATMNTNTGLAAQQIRGASGYEVKPGVVTEPAHQGKGAPPVRRPGFVYTGRLFRGMPVAPEGDEMEVK